MKGSQKLKIALIIIALVFGIIYTLPTFGLNKHLPSFLQKLLPQNKLNLGLDLLGGMHVVLQVEVKGKKTSQEKYDALAKAVEVIRNRVDKFGVTEPLIQEERRTFRIIVQLPGVKDPERVTGIIGKTAQLEFKLVAKDAEQERVLNLIDTFLEKHGKEKLTENLVVRDNFGWKIRRENLNKVKEILEETSSVIPNEYQLLLGKLEEEEEIEFVRLYLVKRKAEITGEHLRNAMMRYGMDPADLEHYNQPQVHLEFNRQGARKFAKVTKKHIKERLAIVLDDRVYSAPMIEEEIRGGRAQIRGKFTQEEAQDLAIVLRAGALPAPVRIIENRTVGPSLGRDSIKQGVLSAAIGAVAVVVFMVFYYSYSGLIAIFALGLNILLITAFLALFQATLTLPGIAGIALTIGMAVDANVLIYERIREELKRGRGLRASIEAGYARAFWTIFDANVTTLIAAFVLYQFGTGPVKGFAVTLSIGLGVSMFTAIVVTRSIFDFILQNRRITTLRI
jgi:protein-export membrane protein SecD